MTKNEFLDRQFRLSVQAGANQRYHQIKAHYWSRWDRGFRIAVGLSAVIGAMLAVVTAYAPSQIWITASIVTACVAAFIGVVLNVVPYADWEREHCDIFRRWCDLREDVDSLQVEDRDKADGERLRQLEAKSHRICGIEPAPDDALWGECSRLENQSRLEAEEEREPDSLSKSKTVGAAANNWI